MISAKDIYQEKDEKEKNEGVENLYHYMSSV